MTTLNAYRVSNRASAIVLGIFLAEDHDAALDASAVRAGYKSHSDIPAELVGGEDIDVVNVESDIDFVVDFVVDRMEKNKEYNGGSYADWNDGAHARDTYCDFSMCDDDELSLDQQRVKEILEDSDAVDIIDDRIGAWLKKAVAEESATADDMSDDVDHWGDNEDDDGYREPVGHSPYRDPGEAY